MTTIDQVRRPDDGMTFSPSTVREPTGHDDEAREYRGFAPAHGNRTCCSCERAPVAVYVVFGRAWGQNDRFGVCNNCAAVAR